MEVWEKSETVDPEVRAYVYSLVNAVGGSSTYDDTYSIGDDALAALNDILRWLRLYDEKLGRFDVKRCLAEANLVKGDLLEILALWPEEANNNKLKAKLALSCLQLLVPLTWPPELELKDENMTVNNHRHLPYLQLAQVGYKRGVLHYEHAKILRTAVRIGLPPMAQPRRERTKRDKGIIKLVLYLFRNMTMITQPQHLPSQGDENEISRSSTIEVFCEQDVFNLLLTIGSGASDEFQEQDVILLEILFNLLKGVDGKRLFMENKQVQTEEAEELRLLMQKEKAMLNGYKKHAPTRHNRFGTMIWVKRDDAKMSTVTGQASITDETTTLQQMDSSKKWNKPKYRGKMTQEFNDQSDFGMRVELTESARKQLSVFVGNFLDSSFNPLFSSLRKAIERETDRVQEMHRRQYFYLINWFLNAECARRDQARRESAWHADRPTELNPEENTFAYIAAVLDQETFVLLNRHMQRAFDEKSWHDLQATLLCFTQILLTVQSMAESPDEEDQEIAENIQQRIFYEESTHDRIVQILRGYTNQGFAYLDAITECVHVFVRMLERYSKQNVDLQIRSKRRARKKRKQQQQSTNGDEQPNPEEDAEDAAEDEREAQSVVSERKFDFARFSAKFLSQPCVNTFVALLHLYTDLSPSQLKRCHRFFYRLAFKHDLVILLFRADILQLFHRLIKGPSGLPHDMEGFKDWEVMVQQIFRRCIKWMSKEVEGDGWKEMCMVEMMFSKIPNTLFYLQNGYERVVEKRAPRPPAELEFKASVGEEAGQRLAVATSLMIDQSKSDALAWVKKELERSVEERQAWLDGQVAMSMANDLGETGEDSQAGVVPPPPTIFLAQDTEERKLALFKDKYLRLLLTTLGMEVLDSVAEGEASWIVPSKLTVENLKESLELIKKFEYDPPTFENGKTAEDLVRSKATAKRSATFSDSEDNDSADDSGDMDDKQFPPNLRESRKDDAERPSKRRRLTRRNQTELTEAELEERAAERRRKDKERNNKIKSQLYVTAEDDESDEERDAEFFRLEEERRKQAAGIIRSKLLEAARNGEMDVGGKGKKKRKKAEAKPKKRTRGESDMDVEEDDDGGSSQFSAMSPPAPSRSTQALLDESTDDDAPGSDLDAPSESEEEGKEETPSTSPPAEKAQSPLREISSNVVASSGAATSTKVLNSTEDDDDDDIGPLIKSSTARRNVRAGFILDDSDSD